MTDVVPKESPFEPDPVIEAYKAGIDRTLLCENLKLSTEERIRNLAQLQRFAEEVRRAGARHRDDRLRRSATSPARG